MSEAHWVITVTHNRSKHSPPCVAESRTWPQVIELPIAYVAPGIALRPEMDYVCTSCGWELRLLSRCAVGS